MVQGPKRSHWQSETTLWIWTASGRPYRRRTRTKMKSKSSSSCWCIWIEFHSEVSFELIAPISLACAGKNSNSTTTKRPEGIHNKIVLQLFSCEWDSPRQQMLHSSYFHKTQSLRFHTKKVNIVTGISGAVESCPDHWHQMCLPVKWFCHSKTQRHLLQLQMDRFHWNKLLLNHLKSSLSWILRAFPDLSVI